MIMLTKFIKRAMRLLPLALLLAAGLTATARRQQSTMPGRLHADAPATPREALPAARTDTLTGDSARTILRMAGYDKPLTATRETIHAGNTSATDTILSISLEITYKDDCGRQLHKRQVELTEAIPPGETLLLHFPTWDTQRSFYYCKGAQPRRRATPYDVDIRPLQVVLTR